MARRVLLACAALAALVAFLWRWATEQLPGDIEGARAAPDPRRRLQRLGCVSPPGRRQNEAHSAMQPPSHYPPSSACSTPAITIIGNVTVDVVDGKKALGGAVSYAAAVASALGVRACIVTARGPHDAAIDRDFSALFEVRPPAAQRNSAAVVVCAPSRSTA